MRSFGTLRSTGRASSWRRADQREDPARRDGPQLGFELCNRLDLLVVLASAAVRRASAVRFAAVLITAAVFGGGAVIGFAYVALSVTGFVRVKIGEGLRSALRQRAVITMAGIVAVIDVAVEAVGP